MSSENKALVQRYYDEAMGDLSGMNDVISEDFIDHHFPPQVPPGPAGVRQFFLDDPARFQRGEIVACGP